MTSKIQTKRMKLNLVVLFWGTQMFNQSTRFNWRSAPFIIKQLLPWKSRPRRYCVWDCFGPNESTAFNPEKRGCNYVIKSKDTFVACQLRCWWWRLGGTAHNVTMVFLHEAQSRVNIFFSFIIDYLVLDAWHYHYVSYPIISHRVLQWRVLDQRHPSTSPAAPLNRLSPLLFAIFTDPLLRSLRRLSGYCPSFNLLLKTMHQPGDEGF